MSWCIEVLGAGKKPIFRIRLVSETVGKQMGANLQCPLKIAGRVFQLNRD
jgi:hypothetical protein